MKNTESIYITNPTNIRFLTGFVGVESRDAYLLILKTKAFLFVSPLYKKEATKVQLNNSFLQKYFPKIHTLKVIALSPDNTITKQLETICTKEKIDAISFEENNLTVSEYSTFKKSLPDVSLKPLQNAIETLRMKKFPSEINSIKKAAKLTDDCFTFIQTKIQRGVTESELTWEIESYFRSNYAELAFSPIVAFGKNSSLPHYNSASGCATQNQGSALKSNDVILLDFGAKINGYCADMTRMIFVGKPKPEWIEAYNTVLKAQTTALDLLIHHFHLSINESESLLNGAAVDKTCRKIIEDAGLPIYPHSLGHGVGLDIHETPRLSIHQEAVLFAGMVITIEPATYIPNHFGIRIEDLLLITNTGIEVLSKSSKEIIIVSY